MLIQTRKGSYLCTMHVVSDDGVCMGILETSAAKPLMKGQQKISLYVCSGMQLLTRPSNTITRIIHAASTIYLGLGWKYSQVTCCIWCCQWWNRNKVELERNDGHSCNLLTGFCYSPACGMSQVTKSNNPANSAICQVCRLWHGNPLWIEGNGITSAAVSIQGDGRFLLFPPQFSF